MTEHIIQETQPIPQEQWFIFFDQLTKTNKGQFTVLEGAVKGEELVQPSSLTSITYDPVTTSKDVVIAMGRDQDVYTYTIIAPRAVWAAKGNSDQVIALNIFDQSGKQTILRFSK